MKTPHIAVIGAGLAGLACAQRLRAAGLAVTLFDKGRRPGGRLATRRLVWPTGEALLDHGAQYFTARTPAFLELCGRLLEAGALRPWSGRVIDQRAPDPGRAETRYLGHPGMNDLARYLAQDLTVHCEAEVSALERRPTGWVLHFKAQASQEGFAAVAVALPAEQTAGLLADVAPALAASAAAARTAPCWAGLFAFAPEAGWPDWQGLRPAASAALGWLARARDGAALVVHASPEWSRAHLEDPPAVVEAALLAELSHYCPGLGPPLAASLNRWRYALVEQAAGTPCEFDPALGLGVCGDWRLGPRVEWAWTAGDALGQELGTAFSHPR